MIEDLAIDEEERGRKHPRLPMGFVKYAQLMIHDCMAKEGSLFSTLHGCDASTKTAASAPQSFYQAYPKVSPDFDGGHHQNQTIPLNYFYLGRWLPLQIQKILFPWDLNTEKAAGPQRKLTASKMPTSLECSSCMHFHGHQRWDRNGEWFCLYEPNVDDVEDELGPMMFTSYSQFQQWRTSLDKRLTLLESHIIDCNNDHEQRSLELELQRLKLLAAPLPIRRDDIISISG